MIDQITPFITTIVIAIVGALATIAAVVIKQGASMVASYLASKMSSNQLAEVKGYAQTSIRFLEQSSVFKNFDGAKKKEMAVLDITQYCKAHNLPFGYSDIDKIAEEAVQIMNVEIGKPFSDFMNDAATPLVAVGEQFIPSLAQNAALPSLVASTSFRADVPVDRYSTSGPVA